MADEDQKSEPNYGSIGVRLYNERGVQTFIDFLLAKWGASRCEGCGVADWEIADKSTNAFFGAFKPNEQGEYGFPAQLAEFLVLGCKNCGNARFIGIKPFMRWLDEQPK